MVVIGHAFKFSASALMCCISLVKSKYAVVSLQNVVHTQQKSKIFCICLEYDNIHTGLET